MQKYGSRVALERFREDAHHRKSMCAAMAANPETPQEVEQAPKFAAIATRAEGNKAVITQRMQALLEAEDLLIEHRALEQVSKFRAKKVYEQARRELALRAEALVPILLPIAPSIVGHSGVKRAIALIEGGLANLAGPDTPESIRTEHVPVVERHLTKMREADLVEDNARTALRALRASIVIFKASQERERELDLADLIALVGRADANAYFLPARRAKSESIEDDDTENDDAGIDGAEKDGGTEDS